MDILALRLRSSSSATVSGAILVNGAPRRARDFLAVSAYVPQVRVGGEGGGGRGRARPCVAARLGVNWDAVVPRCRLRSNVLRWTRGAPQPTAPAAAPAVPLPPAQHDNFVPTMTASETVAFYAAVVLLPDATDAARRTRCKAVLEMMGLAAQRHTLVGPGRKERGRGGGRRTPCFCRPARLVGAPDQRKWLARRPGLACASVFYYSPLPSAPPSAPTTLPGWWHAARWPHAARPQRRRAPAAGHRVRRRCGPEPGVPGRAH
jgi:hypothetical protein